MSTHPSHPLTRLSDDEKMFQAEVEKLSNQVVKPRVLEMDEAEKMDPEVVKQLFAFGLMGIELPEEFGGSGGSFMMAVLAIEALSKVDPSVGVLCDVQNTLVNNIFLRWATPEQKKKYLPQLAQSKVGSYCLTEPNSGSDAFAMKCRAYDEGTHYRLDGKKIFITNAKEADIFIVFANAEPEKGYKGITAFIVERGTPGFSVGKKEVKLGIRASSTCEIICDNVKIPKEN
ncbi:MAG: acyl-CoA dehydrogenase, partial [Proteobacteria bacterium]